MSTALILLAAGTIAAQPFGVTPAGAAVERVTLRNERGMRLSYIDYGATLVEATVADRHGKRSNVLLGLPDLPAFLATQRRHGAVIGRYAGRIGGARFVLDGRTFALPANRNGLAVHGDPNGFDKRVWARQDFADAESVGSIYRLHSPDGDQGMPGALDVAVTYRLMRKRDEFRIEYAARTDAPTVLNLTNHVFFNLAGAGSKGLQTHRFQVLADRYVAADARKAPTGELPPVAGTALDFRTPRAAGELDHGLVFSKPYGIFGLAAVVTDAASGRRMEVLTSEPSVQLFTGNGFDGREVGAEGRAYEKHDGFAFETQHLADSPNQPSFPSTVLRPGQAFRSVTVFRFSRTSGRR